MGSGNARSHRDGGGSTRFSQKNGIFRIFALQIFGLPPALRAPPHKCGGKKIAIFGSLRTPREGCPYS